jgi:hypothetical protein
VGTVDTNRMPEEGPAPRGSRLEPLLSIDPLAALAETQQQLRARLQELVPEVPEELRLAWEATARTALESPPAEGRWN